MSHSSAGNPKVDPDPKFPLLVSYAFLRELKAEVIDSVLALSGSHNVDLLLDSGGFTAKNAGKEIDLEEYMRFVGSNESSFFGYMQLDKLQDPEVTDRNLRTMLDRGLKPVPVHVFGDEQDRMDELFGLTDYVALGGLRRPKRGMAPKNYVLQKMAWAAGRNVHWLGYTTASMVAALTPFSCDCASWNQAVLYGNVTVYEGKGRFTKYTRKDKANVAMRPVIRELLEVCGFEWKDWYDDRRWRRNATIGFGKENFMIMMINCMSWIRYIMDVRRRFGTRVFMATTLTNGEFEVITACLKTYFGSSLASQGGLV